MVKKIFQGELFYRDSDEYIIKLHGNMKTQGLISLIISIVSLIISLITIIICFDHVGDALISREIDDYEYVLAEAIFAISMLGLFLILLLFSINRFRYTKFQSIEVYRNGIKLPNKKWIPVTEIQSIKQWKNTFPIEKIQFIKEYGLLPPYIEITTKTRLRILIKDSHFIGKYYTETVDELWDILNDKYKINSTKENDSE